MEIVKRILLLFTTTGYQAAAFKEAAEKLGVALIAEATAAMSWKTPGGTRCPIAL